jgi:hypothetical protein
MRESIGSKPFITGTPSTQLVHSPKRHFIDAFESTVLYLVSSRIIEDYSECTCTPLLRNVRMVPGKCIKHTGHWTTVVLLDYYSIRLLCVVQHRAHTSVDAKVRCPASCRTFRYRAAWSQKPSS